MVVCSLVQKFDFEFAPHFKPEDWEENLRDYFLLIKGELRVRLKVRK